MPNPGALPALTAQQRQGSAKVARATLARLAEDVSWFSGLSPRDHAGVGAVAEAGILSFSQWYLAGQAKPGAASGDFLAAAPAHLTRVVTLRQALHIIRVSVDTVEQQVSWLHLPGPDRDVREAALRYARDMAFAAAEVYAHAAEARGAWDARLEALLVDSLLRDDVDDSVASLTSALGWRKHSQAVVVAATAPPDHADRKIAAIRKAAAAGADGDCLVGLHSGLVIVVLAGPESSLAHVDHVVPHLEPGPVVIGPPVTHMSAAPAAARAAKAGWYAAAAWPSAPRPVHADELLPERLLAGDEEARFVLRHEVYAALASDAVVTDTVAAYFDQGKSLEATARTLYVHPNTVRYRLRKAADLSGFDPTATRDGYVLQLALTVGLLDPDVN